jgi:hypothetical protein
MNALIAVIFVLLGTGMGWMLGCFYGRCSPVSNSLQIATRAGCSSKRSSPLPPSRRGCQQDFLYHHEQVIGQLPTRPAVRHKDEIGLRCPGRMTERNGCQ